MGNNIEQTTNTYNINTCDKVSSKTCKAKLKQLRQALLEHLLIIIIANRVIIFYMLPKILK